MHLPGKLLPFLRSHVHQSAPLLLAIDVPHAFSFFQVEFNAEDADILQPLVLLFQRFGTGTFVGTD